MARSDATRAVLAWPWIVAGLAALGLLALAGYQLGVSLAASDTYRAAAGEQLDTWAGFSILDHGISPTREKDLEDAIVRTIASSAH